MSRVVERHFSNASCTQRGMRMQVLTAVQSGGGGQCRGG
jgi:hypothetical protein